MTGRHPHNPNTFYEDDPAECCDWCGRHKTNCANIPLLCPQPWNRLRHRMQPDINRMWRAIAVTVRNTARARHNRQPTTQAEYLTDARSAARYTAR